MVSHVLYGYHFFMRTENTMRSLGPLAAAWAVAVVVCGCGGGSSQSPTTPSSHATVTVNIVTSAGNQAFSPNPVQATTGDTLVWKNTTLDLHRLVMDDGSAVIGDIAAGASGSMQLKGAAGNYHCTIHPSMVGSINGATAPTPPPGSGGGY
jgi:plastocyanin